MALDEMMAQEAAPEMQELSPEDEESLEMAVLLGKKLIDDGGVEVINAAEGSKDPGQVIGQFLLQLGSQMGEELSQVGLDIPPAVMLAKGGWLEQMSDFLQEEYGVGRDVMDRAEIYVATAAQDMAAAQQGQQAPQPAQGQAPAMPQGGMV